VIHFGFANVSGSLVGLHTAADVTEKCNTYIQGICAVIDQSIDGPGIRRRWARDRVSGKSNDVKHKSLALAVSLLRIWTSLAPEVKKLVRRNGTYSKNVD
jgi:hypothetical protein